VAYGVDSLAIGQTVVRDTRPAPNGTGGRGIVVRASSRVPSPPTSPVPPNPVSISGTIVERSHGAGVLVEGASATIRESLVRDTMTDSEGHGRGVVIQERYLGSCPASATIDRSVVEGSHDV